MFNPGRGRPVDLKCGRGGFGGLCLGWSPGGGQFGVVVPAAPPRPPIIIRPLATIQQGGGNLGGLIPNRVTAQDLIYWVGTENVSQEIK